MSRPSGVLTWKRFSPAGQQLRQAVAVALRELKPALQAAEERGALLPGDIAPLLPTGIFNLYRPAEYGGVELAPSEFLSIVADIAIESPSLAWVVLLFVNHARVLRHYPRRIQKKLFADGNALLTTSAFPPGTARRVAGGYQLSGNWRYLSGIDVATWAMLPAIGEGGEKLDVFVPAGSLRVAQAWDSVGMRATGSHDMACDALFVPEGQVCRPGEHELDGQPAGPVLSHNATVALGIVSPVMGALSGLFACYSARVMAMARPLDREVALRQFFLRAARLRLLEGGYFRGLADYDLLAGHQGGRAPVDAQALSASAAYLVQEAHRLAVEVFASLGTASAARGQPAAMYVNDIMVLATHHLNAIERDAAGWAHERLVQGARKRAAVEPVPVPGPDAADPQGSVR